MRQLLTLEMEYRSRPPRQREQPRAEIECLAGMARTPSVVGRAKRFLAANPPLPGSVRDEDREAGWFYPAGAPEARYRDLDDVRCELRFVVDEAMTEALLDYFKSAMDEREAKAVKHARRSAAHRGMTAAGEVVELKPRDDRQRA